MLTPAERRVADLVVEGLTNRQIAERSHVTVSTVEGHLSKIFAKLGLESRVHLVRDGVRREMAGPVEVEREPNRRRQV